MFAKTIRTKKSAPDADVTITVSEGRRGANLVPAMSSRARGAATWAAPHVERGRDLAAPRAQAAVDAAVERVSPAIDAAREKLDEVLPRLTEAVAAAAAASASAGATASEYKSRSGDAVAVLRGEAVAKRTSSKGRASRILVIFSVLGAAAAAAFAVFSSRTPKEDPWAVPTGTYPAYTPPAPAAEPAADLTSGSAADVLDADSTAEVPGMTAGTAETYSAAELDSSETVFSTEGESTPVFEETSTSAEPYDPTSPTERS